MVRELEKQQDANARRNMTSLVSPYGRKRKTDTTNYGELLKELKTMVDVCRIEKSNTIESGIDSGSSARPRLATVTNDYLNTMRNNTDNAISMNYTFNAAPSSHFTGNIGATGADTLTSIATYSPAKTNARFYPSHADPTESPAKRPKTVIDLT